ncbi:MAG: hypothetical protein K0R55_2531, partial [Sporomusa sp.]|nr:hypothetical protein [Sporomusa sp.]
IKYYKQGDVATAKDLNMRIHELSAKVIGLLDDIKKQAI